MPEPSASSTPSDPAPVQSPCIGVCVLDAAGRTCVGCRRTIDEIATWSRMDDAQRRAVWARLRTVVKRPRATE